jgi:hypothetical protein
MVAAAVAVGTVTVAACGRVPPSPAADASPAEPAVTARWVADDGSVVAINLVVPVGTDPRRTRELAERQRAEHPGTRLIIRVFASTAGPERFVIGHVPTDDQPLADGSHPASLIALYDFPP